MVVVGARFYESNENANGRQARAREAVRRLDGVLAVNLQFEDETFAPDGFVTLPVLRHDSRTVSGGSGARMPIMSEMLDRLAGIAAARGSRYFLFHNADIQITQDAVDWLRSSRLDAVAFCRADMDAASGRYLEMMIRGVDAVAFDLEWWRRERRHFRPYISGPPWWDNVYAAVICTHGRGTIVTDRQLIRHEQHPSTWSASGAFAEYTGYLAALDAPYFSRWAHYIAAVEAAGAAGDGSVLDRFEAHFFNGPLLSHAGRARHLARRIRAHYRHRGRFRLPASR
jgi:hypothetical protein